MPRGDAARIRAYAVGLVDDARAAGETGMTVRAGDVREAFGAGLPESPHQHMPGLGDPQIAGGGRGGTGGEARAQSGPQLGFRVQARRRQGIAPDAGGGLVRARGPCEPTRRRPPGRSGASGLCADAQFERNQLPGTPGAWRSPQGDGPPRERPSWPFPAAGPQPLDLLPSLLRHDGREGEGGTLCHRHRRATLAHCYHWLLPLARLLRN